MEANSDKMWLNWRQSGRPTVKFWMVSCIVSEHLSRDESGGQFPCPAMAGLLPLELLPVGAMTCSMVIPDFCFTMTPKMIGSSWAKLLVEKHDLTIQAIRCPCQMMA